VHQGVAIFEFLFELTSNYCPWVGPSLLSDSIVDRELWISTGIMRYRCEQSEITRTEMEV